MTFFVPTAWASQRRHGQVPHRDPAESAGIMKMVSQPAPPFDVDRLFERPVMTPQAAVSDLGLSKADESSWAAFIGDVVGAAKYEPAVRQQVAERLLLEAWDPALRRVVLQRSAQLFRDTGMRKSKPGPSKPGTRARVITAAELLKERLEKAGGEGSRGGKVVGHTAAGRPLYEGDKKEGASPSQALQAIRNAMKDTSPANVRGAMIQVTSAGREDAALRPQLKEVVDQFAKMPMPKASLKVVKQASKILSKADAKGGLYHRRVPKTGGGYKYYYDPKSYRESKGAHHSGSDMRTQAMGSEVTKAATDAGHEGCDAKAMRRLAKKYGRAELADHLKSSCKRGKLVYKGKRFYLGKK